MEPVFAVATIARLSKRLGRRGWLTVALGLLAGVVAFAATRAAMDTGGARIATSSAAPEPAPTPECDAVIPTWTLAADPVERVGYRAGRRSTFEVVPLGPDGVEVEVSTARAFLAMQAAAAEACVELRLESGFRTVQEQRELFRAWRKGRGNKAARPGRSNHQSGRALDISVLSVPGALAWLETNAASFGFKRTVKNEPWHWEYVDSPIARGPASKKVSRKALKTAKAVGRTTRPAKRAGSAGKAPATSTRVTASRH